MKEARFYEKLDNERVECRLCPHNCHIQPGQSGFCRVRKNEKGVLYSLNYGRVSSWGIDPIEKKPLYHFYPGSQILSVGTFGCNFRCGFCQNWQIAQQVPPTRVVDPEELVEIAIQATGRGSIGIAYTYSEPMIWYEYVYDTAKLARSRGLKNVLVTNGYIQKEPLKEILPLVDAMNIDVKGFTEDFYHDVCRGDLESVLQTVEIAHAVSHVEITNLVIPAKNDSEEEISKLVDWLASLDNSIPLHLSRYFPHFKFDIPATPVETLIRAAKIARRKLKYVYIGNVWEIAGNDTVCPVCGNILVRRNGYGAELLGIKENSCSRCGSDVDFRLAEDSTAYFST